MCIFTSSVFMTVVDFNTPWHPQFFRVPSLSFRRETLLTVKAWEGPNTQDKAATTTKT